MGARGPGVGEEGEAPWRLRPVHWHGGVSHTLEAVVLVDAHMLTKASAICGSGCTMRHLACQCHALSSHASPLTPAAAWFPCCPPHFSPGALQLLLNFHNATYVTSYTADSPREDLVRACAAASALLVKKLQAGGVVFCVGEGGKGEGLGGGRGRGPAGGKHSIWTAARSCSSGRQEGHIKARGYMMWHGSLDVKPHCLV